MQPRLDANAHARSGLRQAMLNLQREVEASGLEHSLLELVKIRASQINGWNRLAVSFRTVAGSYQPRKAPETTHV